ncbi:MAG: membrane protein [Candidatus Caldatribacteriota bacterium]
MVFLTTIFFFTSSNLIYAQDNTSTSFASGHPVYLAYFYEIGCHDCEKAKAILEEIKFRYADKLIIQSFEINEPEKTALAESLGELTHQPEEERLLVPVIFIGEEYLFRNEITLENLETLVQKYSAIENIPPWEQVKDEEQTAQERIIARFQSFGLAAVAVSGLIDGINPCAFATIIFFISYLTLVNRKGKEIIWVGSIFTLAVFLTYFLVGTGALKVITTLSFLPLVRRIFVLVTALLALILGIVALRDYLQFKKTGSTKDAKLQLPDFLKKRIHKTIRQNVRLSNYLIMAAVTGFLVSILELACTGQIYLPTIIFISNIPQLKNNALIYLLFYNFMFVVPLILVFSFTYWGTSSAQWANLTENNYGKIKLAMTVLFFGLAALLFYTSIF